MTWTVVQVATNASGTSAIFGSATTAGNLIVAVASDDGGSPPTDPASVALTGSSDVFTKDINVLDTNPTAEIALSIWTDPDCSGGFNTVLLSGGSSSGTLMVVLELSGGATSSPVAAAHAAAGPANVLEPSFDSGTAASVGAGCFWLGVVTGVGSGGRAQASPITPWVGQTPLQPGSVTQLLYAFQNAPAAGAPDFSGTFTGPVAGAYYSAAVIAFSPAAGASHTAAAAMAVTPSLNTTRIRHRARSAVTAVTATLHSTRVHGHTRSASRPEVPSLSSGRVRGRLRSAVLSVIPAFTATGGTGIGFIRSAIHAVTPSFGSGRIHGHGSSGVLTVSPGLTSSRIHGQGRSAHLSVALILGGTPVKTVPVPGSVTKTMNVEVNAYNTMTSDLTIRCEAGAPYQGNMRQLSIDRWNYMYPS